MTAARITADQIKWLDMAVYSALVRMPGRRSLDLMDDQYVAAIVNELFPGKQPDAYITRSLQRMRKTGRLVFERRAEPPHWMQWRAVGGGR